MRCSLTRYVPRGEGEGRSPRERETSQDAREREKHASARARERERERGYARRVQQDWMRGGHVMAAEVAREQAGVGV